MPFDVLARRPNPTLDVMVNAAATGQRERLMVLSGTVVVGPMEQGGGIRVVVRGAEPTPEPVGFYVPGCDPLAPEGNEKIWAEAAPTQLAVVAYDSREELYGIGDVSAQLYADTSQGGVRWPYLGFVCYGNRQLTVAYRVTISGGGDPRSARLFS
jgi:hypothetical protein